MGLSFNNGSASLVSPPRRKPRWAGFEWRRLSNRHQRGAFLLPTEVATRTPGDSRQTPGTNKYPPSTADIGYFRQHAALNSSITRALIHGRGQVSETLLLDFTPTSAPNNFSDAVLSGLPDDPSTA